MYDTPVLITEEERKESRKQLGSIITVIAALMLLINCFSDLLSLGAYSLIDRLDTVFGERTVFCGALEDVVWMFSYVLEFFIPLTIVWVVRRGHRFHPKIPFSLSLPEHPICSLLAVLAILTAVSYVTEFLLTILSDIGVPLVYYEEEFPTDPGLMLLYFLSTVLLPAIVEELIFRGYILHLLLPYGTTFAIVVSAVLFGMCHCYVPQLLYATVAGILIGYLDVKGGSLWIGIFIHFLNNLLSYLYELAYSVMEEGQYTVFTLIVDSMVFAVGIVAFAVLVFHYSDPHKEKPLESGAQYTRLIGADDALECLVSLPMLIYVASFLYETARFSLDLSFMR